MNEQQLAAVKQALEALKRADSRDGYLTYITEIEALQSIISQDALYKMAEDAVTIGLSYNDWPKIGCVNHDCDQCKAVQEPVSEDRSRVLFERHWRKTRGPKKSDRELTRHRLQPQTYIQDSANRHWVTWQAALKTTPPAAQPAPVQPVARYCCHSCFKLDGGFMLDRMILCPECGNKRCPKASDHNFSCTGSNEPGQWGSIYTAPPAPQPVPVKTYHDGKPWPVAPKPWVGLTDEEVAEGLRKPFWEDAARAIEAKLKEKNT
jgi:hypothetical protein